MNDKFSKLRQEQKQEQVSDQQQQQQQQSEIKEFASVEEMLRHDAAQTPVPPDIAVKLSESIANEPKPAKSWWQRLFSR